MLKGLLERFRRKRELTRGELAALTEAERQRELKKTLWVGRHEGPPSFTGDEHNR
jgi:hypothetical protein